MVDSCEDWVSLILRDAVGFCSQWELWQELGKHVAVTLSPFQKGIIKMPKRKNSPSITKEQFLARVMSHEPDLDKAIGELVEQLHAYEKKYRMRSEIFFKFIVGTPAEDQEDFLDLATCYRQYFKIAQFELSAEKAAADAIG